MNIRTIIYVLGCILKIEGVFMLLPYITSLIYRESEGWAFLAVSVLCVLFGFLLSFKKPKNMEIYAKEGFVTVAFSWILFSLFGCIPFVLNGDIPNFTDALFETISGFTTTGASILTAVEPLAKCSLLWRSLTIWIGGMGVLVLLLAVNPLKGGSQIHIMRAESPGPSVERLVPKVQNTAVVLYAIYIVLTILEFLFLIAGKMSVFEAVNTAFSTAGTGGFGTRSDSYMSYSPYIQWVVSIFMMLFGINFGAYFLIYIKHFKQAFKYEEVRYYLFIVIAATFIIFTNTFSIYNSIEETVRHAFFQVTALITTTGFASVDFNLWPSESKVILILLMFVGACAGSTGGGIKVSRIAIALKTVKKEIMINVHPSSVKKIKMEGKPIAHETIRATNVFFITYIVIFATSAFLLAFDEHDLVTNFTAVLATLNNIGPGLEQVGPTGNFASFTPFSKYVLMFNMLAGRLELYPMLMILNYGMWKSAFAPKMKSGILNLKNKEK